MDTEVRLIDEVHDISCNATLQVLVINNSNQHVNFLKGMKIGHLEPPINDLAQIPINSVTTQWMLPKAIKLDSFTPPKYQLDSTTQQQLDYLQPSRISSRKTKQLLVPHHSHRCQLTQEIQIQFHRNPTPLQ